MRAGSIYIYVQPTSSILLRRRVGGGTIGVRGHQNILSMVGWQFCAQLPAMMLCTWTDDGTAVGRPLEIEGHLRNSIYRSERVGLLAARSGGLQGPLRSSKPRGGYLSDPCWLSYTVTCCGERTLTSLRRRYAAVFVGRLMIDGVPCVGRPVSK